MTADPYEASAGAEDPGSWNRYSYVQGDPVNFNDPRGLWMEESTGCQDQARVASVCTAFGGGYSLTIRERSGYTSTNESWGEVQHSARVAEATAYSITTRLDFGDGSSITSVNEGRFRHSQAALLNGLQTVLDVAGLVPGIGEVADGINAGIYAFRGDWANSALSVASMIPFGGQAAGGARLARRFTPDQTALIDLVSDSVRRAGGLRPSEIDTVRDWAREVGVAFRGPESHPTRQFGRNPHVHVGPINHIPVIP